MSAEKAAFKKPLYRASSGDIYVGRNEMNPLGSFFALLAPSEVFAFVCWMVSYKQPGTGASSHAAYILLAEPCRQ